MEYEYALEHVSEIVTKHMDLMKYFKAKTYEGAFYKYMEECRPILESLEEKCKSEPDKKEAYIKEMAEHFVEQLSEDKKGKKVKKSKLNDYKFIIALYTVPMIGELNLEVSGDMIGSIHENWNTANPDNIFQIGTFGKLKDGFRQKKLCYITTAVCRYEKKEDDGYELTMFRNFRDNYMRKQKDGEALINEYYEIAPQIVAQIDLFGLEDEVYPYLWKRYLEPCLKFLEQGDNKACMNLYLEMVNKLKEDYCIMCA